MPIVEEAVSRGIHLLCEKPIGVNLADAERIAMLVNDAGIVFKPCHQYHHSPLWKTVRGLLPRIGRVRLANYEVRRLAANPGNPNWVPEWRTSRSLAGGGILIDHGAHVFYQLRAAMGEATRVRATMRTLEHKGYGVEDTAFILLECADAVAEVTLTWAAHRRENRFRFVGENGEITGDEDEVRLWTPSEQTAVHPGGLSADSSHSDWYAPLFTDFLRQVRDKAPAREDVQEAVYVARVIECAYASSDSDRVVAMTSPILPATVDEPVLVATASVDLQPPPERAHAEADLGSRRARRAVWQGMALAGTVGGIAWMLQDVGWASVWTHIKAVQPEWIAAAVVVNLAVLVFQSARWLALVKPLAPGATLGSAFKAMITGFTVSSFVPARGGELARVEMFGRETGLPRMVVMGSVLLDTLVNASVLLLGAALLPLFVSVPLWLRPGGWATLCLFSLGATVVFALRPRLTTPNPMGDTGRVPMLRGLTALVTQVRQGLGATAQPKALAWSLSASLAAWMLEVKVAAFSMRAVGLELPLGPTLLVLLAVNIALALPVATPANIGTLEIGATLALVELGVPKEKAVAFAVAYHLLQLIPIGLIGLAIFLRGRIKARAAGGFTPRVASQG
ncbi:MAG TPA: lysylphosphatidylglycerol synthase domain-containing protein, partial [Vicinamibacteria bacterium]|nr:lysylphosphatidylglycerol synthase domain-containing protein [Vicinamibacteria bacterium]